MTTNVTRRNLDGFAETLSRDIGPCYVEHSTGHYTLFAQGGSRELLHGRTKSELFDQMHAMALGLRIAMGDDSVKLTTGRR